MQSAGAMIELFTIFGRGGLVLWSYGDNDKGRQMFTEAVNELLSSVLLQQRAPSSVKHQGTTLKYRLDNEFDLVLVIGHNSMVQMGYADRLLDEVQLCFRDTYRGVLEDPATLLFDGPLQFQTFDEAFKSLHEKVRAECCRPTEPSSSAAAAVEEVGGRKKGARPGKFQPKQQKSAAPAVVSQPEQGGAKPKAGKKARVWDLTGTNKKDAVVLDYSSDPRATAVPASAQGGDVEAERLQKQSAQLVGKMRGELPGLDEGESGLDEGESGLGDGGASKTSGSGWFSSFKSLVGDKQLTRDELEPALDKMREALITKNVAVEVAGKICESVAAKLEGRVIGTFSRVQTTVQEAMREALIQLLTPKRRVDILSAITEAKSQQRPYVIVFCGVNGVGKSTNLAKVAFWLIENGHRVLIAAGDTFRAGAVEQLRTHQRQLNALHAETVQLYEQGYGKDPANLASAAIKIAREARIDVVLVDTAGRMQDNEPLMRSLGKLIRVSEPDLVLFVGEALVGNEAVDQLAKFNQALADNSAVDSRARLIDGIVLTKFDTIDDKVGAAISMTYTTGQPIVFVGTGQRYSDLKSLNVNTVVNSLMK